MIIEFQDFTSLVLTDEAFKPENLKVYPPLVTSNNVVLTTGEFFHALQQRRVPIQNRPVNNLVIVRKISDWISPDRIPFLSKTRVPQSILMACIDYIAQIDSIDRKKIVWYGLTSYSNSDNLIRKYFELLATGRLKNSGFKYYTVYELINRCAICGLPVTFLNQKTFTCSNGHISELPKRILNRIIIPKSNKENIVIRYSVSFA